MDGGVTAQESGLGLFASLPVFPSSYEVMMNGKALAWTWDESGLYRFVMGRRVRDADAVRRCENPKSSHEVVFVVSWSERELDVGAVCWV